MAEIRLRQDQALSLEEKLDLTRTVISEWHEYWSGKVFLSFSGGKDSTVLLHITRELYPETPAVFIDTGIEYPEIVEFVKSVDNVVWLRPAVSFDRILQEVGYPVINKKVAGAVGRLQEAKDDTAGLLKNIPEEYRRLAASPFKISDRCCYFMKKQPMDAYIARTNRKPMIAILGCESINRTREIMRKGYNGFALDEPVSFPLAFWLEEDIVAYIKKNNLRYSSVYGDLENYGEKRTICMFCLYGCHREPEPNKFQRMKKTHPRQYEYGLNQLGLGKVLDFIGIKY